MSKNLFFDEPFLRKLERLSFLYRQAAYGPLQGERRSTKHGQSVEFSDFRPYVPGDDFRRIDWNAYARFERFFLKLFVEEQDSTVHLLLDTSRSMDWGEPNKLIFSAHIVGALGYIALLGLDRVRLCIMGTAPIPPFRGKQSTLRLFTHLESIRSIQMPESPMGWLHTCASKDSTPGPLVLFSDLLGEDWKKGIQILRKRGFEITIVHVLSPDEVEPELEGDIKLIDSENSTSLEITADFNLLSRYHSDLAKWRLEWSRFCAARGISYIPVVSSTNLDEMLFTVFPSHRVLQ